MHVSGSSGTSVYLSLSTSIRLIFLIVFSSIFLSSTHQDFVRRQALLVTRHAGQYQVIGTKSHFLFQLWASAGRAEAFREDLVGVLAKPQGRLHNRKGDDKFALGMFKICM